MTQSANHRILIAEDDQSLRLTLQSILEPFGYDTLLAADGHEALQIVEVQPVDGLLLDMHMPGLTGLEVVRRVRGSRRVRSFLPCVMLTADVSDELRRQARSLRVATVLIKPIRREQVTRALSQALMPSSPTLGFSDRG